MGVWHARARYIRGSARRTSIRMTERSSVMVGPGHVFRRAFSWLPTQLASQSAEPVGPRQFGSTEHLSTEAIAAFVDGELSMKGHLRAAGHMSQCPECAAEIEAQGQARKALRESCPIAIPTALLGALSQIPNHSPPQPPAESDEQQFADSALRDRRKRR
jgi:hypothetical protein